MAKRATQPVDIHELCAWKRAKTKPTLKKHQLDVLFEQLGIGAQAEELFGQPPEVHVHHGDVAYPSSLLCKADGNGVFIIEGDLDVAGAFTFYAADAYTILVVAGDLRAAHLHQAWDTQLVVLGSTTIAGLLSIDISDAGFAVFRGPVTSKDRVIHDHVESDVPMFAQAPRGKARSFAATSIEPDELHAALLAGEVSFAEPPPPRTTAPATPTELEQMTVAQFFAGLGTSVVGITGAHILAGKISTDYLIKGKSTQPFWQLVLRDDTVVEAFPATLAKVTEVKVQNYKDARILDQLLRLLPQLTGLEKLEIQNTVATALPPELGDLANLEELGIYGNKQLRTLPAAMARLSKLRKLRVRDNPIEAVPPELLALRAHLTHDQVEGVEGWPED